MPISISQLTSGQALDAATFNNIFKQIEDFLNGGMAGSDLQTSSTWAKERHVVKPEFYGAPSPRTLLVSSDLHDRTILDNLKTFVITNDVTTDFIPIPGLSATIYADIDDDESSTQKANAVVNAVFFCLEKEAVGSQRNSGLTDGSPILSTTGEVEFYLVATFALYVNGSKITGTERYLYSNYDGFAFKNHGISAMIQLSRGMNDVSVRVKPNTDSSTRYFYQIMIRERNINIEVLYK